MTQDNLTSRNIPTSVGITAVSVNGGGSRIQWGAIFAGLFAALSTLIVLNVLGAAIGLSAWQTAAEGWTMGAAIWGVISMIIAFLLGGWVAARLSNSLTPNASLIHGAMVWAVAIPLSVLILGGYGAMYAQGMVSDRDATARVDTFDRAQPAGATIGDRVAGADMTAATRTAAGAAWATLVALLLGLGAAALGGYMGVRDFDYERRSTTPTSPSV